MLNCQNNKRLLKYCLLEGSIGDSISHFTFFFLKAVQHQHLFNFSVTGSGWFKDETGEKKAYNFTTVKAIIGR